MEKDFINPFSDYGSIVCGERFINRRDDIRAVENRVIRPHESGNLAIVGDYRVGKSSLVYKSVMERKSELLNNRRIPVWINLATFDQASIFFRSLVTSSYDEIEGVGWLIDSIKLAADRALQDEVSWSEGYGRIQRYFQKVREAGIRVLFILDEFDHARYLFKGDVSGFQGLRELSYRPEWRINLVTTSRRSLQSIEIQTKAISTLDHTFHKHYLGMFDENALEEYFGRLTSVGIKLKPLERERLLFYCGGHPYLLEMLGYEVVELFRETSKVDIEKAAKRVEQSFIDHYEHMVNVLREDGSLNKLLQILFGPVVDVKFTDAEELQRYGLIRPAEEGNFITFSGHFQMYLKIVERKVDLWPLWRETETALRQVIKDRMIEQHRERWIEALLERHPNLEPIFKKCKDAMEKEKMSFGTRASRNLIDFTYPQDLFAIIFAEWPIFKDIFGKDRNYWDQRAQLLSKIRNPLAHNREQLLNDYERQTAEGFCKEIISIIRKM